MPDYLATLLGGLAGTLAMTLFLLVPRWVGIGNVDVIRAVGTLMTGKLENAFMPGLVIHCGMGILFAFIYRGLMALAHLPFTAVTGAMAGTIHGVIVMMLVCIVILEHHPMARYHERGPMTGLMQLLAHILYGMIVGLVAHSLTVQAPL